MIILRNVSLYRSRQRKQPPLIRAANAVFGDTERVGILIPAGAGKSSLARLLCGIDAPDRGGVLRHGRVSWPLGFAGFLHPNLTVDQNIDLVARIAGLESGRTIQFCRDFCGLNTGARMMRDLSPTERAMLAYACTMSGRFAHLIADDTITVGGPAIRDKCDALLQERLRNAGLVFLSKSIGQLRRHCDTFYTLLGGTLIRCASADAAEDALNEFNLRANGGPLIHA